jgi:protein required for attachment to host cells
MRDKAMIEHDLVIVVCDAQHAHIYRNTGTAQSPALAFMMGFEQKNPPSSQQGTDKPGTAFGSALGRRSHMDETDYHRQREKLFSHDIVRALSDLQTQKKLDKFILIAPPRMLALLRDNMPQSLKAITCAEIDKNLTKHPTDKIVDLVNSYRS